MRFIFGVILFGHAFAHLPGFLVFWRLATLKELPYSTTLFAGSVNVGDAGIRVVGILWLVAALAFAACAAGVMVRASWWPWITTAAAVFSLLLCTSGWPASRIGLLVNAAILVFLLVATRVASLA